MARPKKFRNDATNEGTQVNTMAAVPGENTMDKAMPARSPRAQCRVCKAWMKCTASRKGNVDYIRREVEIIREWTCPDCGRSSATVDRDKIHFI